MENLQIILTYSCIFIPMITLIIILLIHPKYFILSFLAFSPFINIFWSYRIANFSVIEIFYGIFPLFFVFIYVKKRSDNLWVWGKFNIYFILILVAYLIPFFRLGIKGKPAFSALELFVKILFGYAVYSLSINVFEHEEKDKLINCILFAVSISNLMCIYQVISGKWATLVQGWQVYGLYHDPGQYSRMALIGIVILFPLLKFTKSNIPSFYTYGMLVLCIFALGYSVSRNVVLSAIVVFIVCGFLLRKYSLILIYSLTVLAVYVASPKIQLNYEQKIQKEISFIRGDAIQIETLGSGRIGIWERHIERFKEAGLVEKLVGSGEDIGPHGQIIGLLRSIGIFGLIVSILFYVTLLKYSFKKFKEEKNNFVALYSFLIVVVTFVMSIGSAPMTNFYLQGILFMFIALLENRERVIESQPSNFSY